MATNPRKVTVLLRSAEFERFASYCRDRGFKKSTLIARLIRDHLDEAGFRSQQALPLVDSTREDSR